MNTVVWDVLPLQVCVAYLYRMYRPRSIHFIVDRYDLPQSVAELFNNTELMN